LIIYQTGKYGTMLSNWSLTPRHQAARSINKQSEMDKFIHENLQSGQTHPSNLLMASPVFFIKKKDGFLQLMQDY
jgi:hypothetical protein